MEKNNQQPEQQKFEIDKPYVIVCEGKDDCYFLKAYLSYLDKNKIINQNLFKIIETEGVTNIPIRMKNYHKYDNYYSMKGFLFIRDADKKPASAVDSMVGNIKDIWGVKLDRTGDFKIDSDKIKIGFFIFPGLDNTGNYRAGTLEDFCSEIFNLSDSNTQTILSLVAEHMNKLSDSNITFKTPHKNRLHLCLDSTNNFIGNKIGEAASRKAFDFSSDKFSVLKTRIMDLTK